MAIDGITSVSGVKAMAPAVSETPGGSQAGFGDALRQLIGSVDGSAGEANQAIANMLDGSGDVHEAMIAMQRADTTFELTVQVRNKLVQAYQDIMRMPM